MTIKEKAKKLNDVLKYERKVLSGMPEPDINVLKVINKINEQQMDYTKAWNEAIDKRCLDIVHKWGERYDIEELKNFNFSMSDDEMKYIINKYGIESVIHDDGFNGKIAFLRMKNHKFLPCDMVYVIKNDGIKYIVEE